MNQIFKVVFNKALQLFTVTSELAKAKGKKSVKAAVAAAVLGLSLAGVSGSAMADSKDIKIITSSDGSIILNPVNTKEAERVDLKVNTDKLIKDIIKDKQFIEEIAEQAADGNTTNASMTSSLDANKLTVSVRDTVDTVVSTKVDLSGLQTTQGNTNAENIKTNADNISKLENQIGKLSSSTPKTYELGAGSVIETDENGDPVLDGERNQVIKDNVVQITLSETSGDKVSPAGAVDVIGDGSVVKVSYDQENGAIKITGTDTTLDTKSTGLALNSNQLTMSVKDTASNEVGRTVDLSKLQTTQGTENAKSITLLEGDVDTLKKTTYEGRQTVNESVGEGSTTFTIYKQQPVEEETEVPPVVEKAARVDATSQTTQEDGAENKPALTKIKGTEVGSMTLKAGNNVTITADKDSEGNPTGPAIIALKENVDLGEDGSVEAGNTTINKEGITTNKVQADRIEVKNSSIVFQQGDVNMGGNQIHGVAAGTAYNDAVNFAQLKATEAQLNQRIDSVDKHVDRVEDNAYAGIAMALATAGLPQSWQPGKSMIAMAAGTYMGEQGYAIGVSHNTENGKWSFKATASGNSQGHWGGSVGAGYMW